MEKFEIVGGNPLKGRVKISGAKNSALKAVVAACLTDQEVVLNNVPLINDFSLMLEIFKSLGGDVNLENHKVKLRLKEIKNYEIPLEMSARARATIMFIAPLLARFGKAIIPNPGGCRLGARPVDRLIDGLIKLGADIKYDSETGYFNGRAQKLVGTNYRFDKNSHTGTETLIIAAVLAKGKTIIDNAAAEPEIDELINLLTQMGADVKRIESRKIVINGVEKLHGAEIKILPDRNEIVTFALAGLITKGDVAIEDAGKANLDFFIDNLRIIGAGFEKNNDDLRFFYKEPLKAINIKTDIYPGFMTDWQAPWAVLMTQAVGVSEIHETVFENKFSYIEDLKKMGANIEMFNPDIKNKEEVYNFNLEDDRDSFFHAIRIKGPTKLHNAIVTMRDLRAGAAVVLAALAASGKSTIFDTDIIDRGYEKIDDRLKSLGANIKREKEI